jgi:ribosome biogenesis protein MAK21
MHFHPSVSVSAAHLLSHEPLSGKPDLTLHTLTHFLGRFVYRSPKAAAPLRGSSLMQPLAGTDSQDLLVAAGGMSGKARAQEPVNSEAFWRKRAEQVAAEDVFFHEYFNRLGKEKRSKKEKKAEKGPVARAEEAVEDESDNESEIWKALVESRPELEGDDDDDLDLDMDDLDSAFEDEDDGDEDVIFNDESDEEAEEEEEGGKDSETGTTQKAKEQLSDEDEDAFDMDVSDDEAFRDSDEDLPSDLDVGGVDVQMAEKDEKAGRKKRQKLSHLPTFASVDDYAALLADEDDGM